MFHKTKACEGMHGSQQEACPAPGCSPPGHLLAEGIHRSKYPLLPGMGGAVAASNVSDAMLLASDTYSDNSAGTNGGALALTDSAGATMTLQSSQFSSNEVCCHYHPRSKESL